VYSETEVFTRATEPPKKIERWSVLELRTSYEGRINDLKKELDEVKSERDYFRDTLFHRIGLIKTEDESKVTHKPIRMVQSPMRAIAQLESERRRKHWEEKVKEAEANGQLPVGSSTSN
jgi:hypothetical protein